MQKKTNKKQKNVQKWHVRASAAAHLWRGNVRGVEKLEAECLGGGMSDTQHTRHFLRGI